ncbi:MAG: DUF1684 domain-containing protein [Acidobacteriota bacterium]|nr:DUF1684 domain-containing protein [Acidobacteriota bacterium]
MAAAACSNAPADDTAAWAKQLEADRAAKDAAFRSDPQSPVPVNLRNVILPLQYYPPNPAYRVPAELVPAPGNTVMRIPTSTGQVRTEQEYGTLEFSLLGHPLKLTAFVEEGSTDASRLFVPFTDLTSGKETYGGGRYMDLDATKTGIYVIDFNRAYNPYCCYSENYDCPIPPPQNRLPVPVKAGEKLPKAGPGA